MARERQELENGSSSEAGERIAPLLNAEGEGHAKKRLWRKMGSFFFFFFECAEFEEFCK